MKRLPAILAPAMVLLLAACDGSGPVRLPETQVGLEATIRNSGRDFDMEVTAFQDGVATMDRFWHGETFSTERHYRGLYQVFGDYPDASVEIDLDEKAIDNLFPLKAGKTTSFEGTQTVSEPGNSSVADLWIHMDVIKQSSIVIDDKSYETWVIEIQTQAQSGESSETSVSTVYYSEKLGMILKKTIRKGGHQYFWKVTKIKMPEDAGVLRRRPGQSRGTIMI